jgi:hypothetical protein
MANRGKPKRDLNLDKLLKERMAGITSRFALDPPADADDKGDKADQVGPVSGLLTSLDSDAGEVSQLFSKLSIQQVRWLRSRMTALSDLDACRESGVSDFTVQNWVELPLIRRLLDLLARDYVFEAQQQIRASMGLAVAVLVEIVRNGPVWAKLQAAQQILDRGLGKPIQHVDQETTGKLEIVFSAKLAEPPAATDAPEVVVDPWRIVAPKAEDVVETVV